VFRINKRTVVHRRAEINHRSACSRNAVFCRCVDDFLPQQILALSKHPSIIRRMRMVAMLMAWVGLLPVIRAGIPVASVALLYNSADAESRELAMFYQKARSIPSENLIGLDLPKAKDITRQQYEDTLQNPLREIFDDRRWWSRAYDSDKGVTIPVRNQIQVLVTFRGVPLRIKPAPKPEVAEASAPQDPVADRDEAAVDSELSMIGVEGVPITGVMQNRFFKSEISHREAKLPFLILTARIDAASKATCERMISDAIAVEKSGLWGRGYIDIANKFPQGDAWLQSIASESAGFGIPTVVDGFNETMPKNYPMLDASIYYGWYDWHVGGPFLNPSFRFRKGAVAVHLHSFSAEQLQDSKKNWCAPLLEKGAAVSVGNVYEPYLHLTHHLEILHQRLLAGHTWVESAWMAMPVCSWQGVLLGDPLYRPFLHRSGSGEILEPDIEFRALRAAVLQWPKSSHERQGQLAHAADRMQSGILAETMGLELTASGRHPEATTWFLRARSFYQNTPDKMRIDFHMIAMDRKSGRKESALKAIRDARMRYGPIPEAEALTPWELLLDPPPPPPKAKPKQKLKPS